MKLLYRLAYQRGNKQKGFYPFYTLGRPGTYYPLPSRIFILVKTICILNLCAVLTLFDLGTSLVTCYRGPHGRPLLSILFVEIYVLVYTPYLRPTAPPWGPWI
jgi:hypothetical protein